MLGLLLAQLAVIAFFICVMGYTSLMLHGMTVVSTLSTDPPACRIKMTLPILSVQLT